MGFESENKDEDYNIGHSDREGDEVVEGPVPGEGELGGDEWGRERAHTYRRAHININIQVSALRRTVGRVQESELGRRVLLEATHESVGLGVLDSLKFQRILSPASAR